MKPLSAPARFAYRLALCRDVSIRRGGKYPRVRHSTIACAGQQNLGACFGSHVGIRAGHDLHARTGPREPRVARGDEALAQENLSLKQEIEGLKTTGARSWMSRDRGTGVEACAEPGGGVERWRGGSSEEEGRRRFSFSLQRRNARRKRRSLRASLTPVSTLREVARRPTCATIAMRTVAGVPSSVRCLLRPSKDPASSISTHESMCAEEAGCST